MEARESHVDTRSATRSLRWVVKAWRRARKAIARSRGAADVEADTCLSKCSKYILRIGDKAYQEYGDQSRDHVGLAIRELSRRKATYARKGAGEVDSLSRRRWWEGLAYACEELEGRARNGDEHTIKAACALWRQSRVSSSKRKVNPISYRYSRWYSNGVPRQVNGVRQSSSEGTFWDRSAEVGPMRVRMYSWRGGRTVHQGRGSRSLLTVSRTS